MSDSNSQVKKTTDSIITQPEDSDLPTIEFLSYPKEDGRRKAIAAFDNGSRIQFREDSSGHVRQETFFSDGRECESIPVDKDTMPSQHLVAALKSYCEIDKPQLRISWPELWPVLDID